MRKIRRTLRLSGFALLVVGLAACAPLPRQEPGAAEDKNPIPETVVSHPSAPEAAKPDAIFFLPPTNQPFPAEVTQSLREILAGLHGRKNILFTLEAWPLADGSREVNIGLARQAVNRLRDKLVEMGVRPYRIKTFVRGEQKANTPKDALSSPDAQRVDLFLSGLADGS